MVAVMVSQQKTNRWPFRGETVPHKTLRTDYSALCCNADWMAKGKRKERGKGNMRGTEGEHDIPFF